MNRSASPASTLGIPPRRFRTIASALLLLFSLPAAAYRVEIDAPKPLKGVLEQFLDLARYADREDLTPDQLDFMVARAPEQVAKLAATEGFFSTSTEVNVEAQSGETVVRVAVAAGPRTIVSEVDIKVEGSASERSPEQVEQVQESWSLNRGDAFRQEEWEEAKQRGLQILQRRRYAAAAIASSEARILADEHAAELGVTYDSGPVFTFGALQISGTARYPESIVRNVSPLREGEEYSADKLLEFQRQVLRTPYFSNAVIDIARDPAQADLAPVSVRVTEFPAQRVRAGAGYTTDTGAHLDARYSHNNLFDRAWVLDTQATVEQRRQLGALELALPPGRNAFVNSLHGSIERTTLEGVELRSRRAGVRRTRNTDIRDLSYSLEYYRDELERIGGAPLPRDVVVSPGAHQALVLGLTKTRRQVDNPAFPRKGRIVTLQAGIAVKGLLTDQTFLRGYGRLREFIPVGSRDLVILRAELGAVVSKGGNTAIPASLLFRAGGTDSVRGYAFQSIGNERDGTVYPTRFLATGGAEYQRWPTERWGGAVFYDVGMASDRWNERELFHAVGVGARMRSPVGRVNVDLAYGLRDGTIRPHVSLGVAF
ncbi:MAG TPA: autotransporter assembly complex family protein [Noviherbaspirillum sp.]|uniref:autotransporter assembly complex protein TamA n=1 Tax=Noviherbaspirillum sp. TaxID=1926288 RepID=UPI002D2D797B|nr:autotransporter assembly complex family protein [Noviherbaspirillum sp.]HYD96257.1 autotransporter assembly complex family protein [Noviherbaspirillum sp.]